MAYTLPFVFFLAAFGSQLNRMQQATLVAAAATLTLLWLVCSVDLVAQMVAGHRALAFRFAA